MEVEIGKAKIERWWTKVEGRSRPQGSAMKQEGVKLFNEEAFQADDG